MEKVKNDIGMIYDYDFLLNRTGELLREYADTPENEIDNLTVCSNTQFTSALQFAGRSLFAGFNLEKDLLLLLLSCRVFCDVSAKYNKVVSIVGLSCFTCIDVEIIKGFEGVAKSYKLTVSFNDLIVSLHNVYINTNYNLQTIYNNTIYVSDTLYDNNRIQTAVYTAVFNRLQINRENALKNKLMDGKQQVGIIAVGNNEYKWSAERIAGEERARALSIADLPKLPNYVNS